MSTNNNTVLTYKFNKKLMAEIESLTQTIHDRIKAIGMSEHHLTNSLRNISNQKGIHKWSQLTTLKFNDPKLEQMLRVLIRKQYAFEHDKAISRGKAIAKRQRELNNLTIKHDSDNFDFLTDMLTWNWKPIMH